MSVSEANGALLTPVWSGPPHSTLATFYFAHCGCPLAFFLMLNAFYSLSCMFYTYYYFSCFSLLSKSGGSAVGIATSYGLEHCPVGVRFESRKDYEFSPLHIVQTGFGAQPISYPGSTTGFFPGGKVAGA
jgi:hypothetical protein